MNKRTLGAIRLGFSGIGFVSPGTRDAPDVDVSHARSDAVRRSVKWPR